MRHEGEIGPVVTSPSVVPMPGRLIRRDRAVTGDERRDAGERVTAPQRRRDRSG